MSDLVFVGIGVLAVVVWQLVAAARRARRDGTPILVRLRHGLRRRPPRSIDVSIAARGAWMHSLAAAYAPAPMRVVIQARELAALVCAMVAVAGTEAVVAFGPVLLGRGPCSRARAALARGTARAPWDARGCAARDG